MSRPSPFALPPATGGRFGLLVLATVTSSAYLYSWIAGHLSPVAAAGRYCAGQARVVAPRVLADALADWYTGCSHWASLQEAAAVAVMLAVLLAGVLLHYLFEPWLIRRRLAPLESSSEPAAVREALRGTAVTVFVDYARPRGTRAFGNRLGYSIAIGSADLAGPDGLAVLAHEIGHVRNRDLDATALTTAVWRAFLVLAALPTLIWCWNDPAGLRYYGWRVAALLLLVYVLRCQVIRTREFYADHAAGPLFSVAALARRGPEGGFRQRRFHPRREQRAAVLADPAPLFRLDAAVAAAAGALVGLAYRPGYHFVSVAWPSSVFGKDVLCGILFGGLAAATLAGATWRSALWSVAAGRPARVALATGAFAAGLLAGDLIAPAEPGTAAWATTALRSPGPGLAVALVLVLGVWLFLRWVSTAAAPRVAAAPRPRRRYHAGLVPAVLVAGVWLGFWFRLADVFELDPHWRAVAFGSGAAVLEPVPLLVVWLAGLYASTPRRGAAVARDLRAPWGLVHGFAGGVLLAYALCLAADHQAIAAAITLAQDSASAAGLWPLGYLLYAPAVLVTTVGALVAGLAYASRHRTGQLLAALVSVLPALAAGLFLTSLGFVTALDGLDRDFGTLVAGLGKLPGAASDDQPRFASLGLMILALYAILLVTVVPAAWFGGRLRRLLRRAPAAEVALPGRWRTVAWLLPSTLAAVAVATLGLREWSAAVTTADLRLDYDTTAVQVVQDQVRPGSLAAGDACLRLYAGGTSFPYRVRADAGAAGQVALLAAAGMSADDVVMQRLGRAAMDALNLRELATGAAAVSDLLRYCAAISPSGPAAPQP